MMESPFQPAVKASPNRTPKLVAQCSNNPTEQATPAPGFITTLSKNMVLGIARVMVNSLVVLVLPAYLTHRLPVEVYGAWALVLQLGALVSFLDLGIQTGISKFVAEHIGRNDPARAGQYASSGFALMTITACIGCIATLALVYEVPRLFHNMSPFLYPDVRMCVLLVGISLSLTLLSSSFAAVFMGVQQYAVPVSLTILNRLLYAGTVCSVVGLHGSLRAMGIAAALTNLTTSMLQYAAWRMRLNHIPMKLQHTDSHHLAEMTKYCSVLSLWSAAMLCISGLDVTIVGHYVYGETAYYSLAALPANFIALIAGAVLSPFMPAASALSSTSTPSEMGELLLRVTRYSTILAMAIGLPLIAGGSLILGVWAGKTYAAHSSLYLQILVAATMIRNLCLPYATTVVALGKQRFATAAAMGEAIVNLGASLYLVRVLGGIGVAMGTLLGAMVSVLMHFAISMRYTESSISISRLRLLFAGTVRPAATCIPTLMLILWRKGKHAPQTTALSLLFWLGGTLLLLWYVALSSTERASLRDHVKECLRQIRRTSRATLA